MNEDCGDCRFWSRSRGDMEFGLCRRNAPAITKVSLEDVQGTDLWPTTFIDWWCGEWKPKPDDLTPTT